MNNNNNDNNNCQALTGAHYSHTWRVHQTMCKAMERLPWKQFVYAVKLAIGNDLQQAAEENADKISFESIPCSRSLLQKFNQFKRRVKCAENFWTSRKKKHIDIF